MAAVMPLWMHASEALGLNQREIAALLGISTRTVQRWAGRRASPGSLDHQRLAQAVHPKDPGLAAQLAQAGGASLAALGLGQPEAPAPPALAPEHLVDSVVCVASAATGIMPDAVRPGLLAAFTRARQLGLSIDAVERALRGPEPAPAKARAEKPKA